MIPHSRPTLDQDDYKGILEVLKSGFIAQGERVKRFEKDLSSLIGMRHGVAVSSGTAALHLSLISLGVGKGDEIIVPSFVCTALLNAIHYVGAAPVIADIERFTFNIDINDLKNRITKRTKAIILPHMFGLPASVDDILTSGIPVIEDCAHSIGSTYKNTYTGSLGAVSIFSFFATKMIATGEGGMILSNDGQLIETIKDSRDYDEKEIYAVRYNYKMTDMQASLGISQLEKLSSFVKKRKNIAKIYNREFQDAGIVIPSVPADRDHIYYRYVVLVENAREFIDRMGRRGISCRRPVFKPLHRYMGLSGYEATEWVWERAVSIPLYPSLSNKEIDEIIESVKSALL